MRRRPFSGVPPRCCIGSSRVHLALLTSCKMRALLLLLLLLLLLEEAVGDSAVVR